MADNTKDKSDQWAEQYTQAAAPDKNAELREKQKGDTDIERQGKESFAYKHPFMSGLARGAATLGGIIPESTNREDYSFIPTIKAAVTNPKGTLEAAGEIGKGMWDAQADRWKRFQGGIDQAKKLETEGHPFKSIGTTAASVPYGLEAVVPGVGPWVGGMADQAEHAIRTRDPYEGGQVIGGALAGGALGGGKNKGVAYEAAKDVGEKVAPHIPEVMRHPQENLGKMRWEGPKPERLVQGRVMPAEPAPGATNPFVRGVEHAAGIAGGGVVGSAVGHPVVGAIAGGSLLPTFMDRFIPEPEAWKQGREISLFDEQQRIANEKSAAEYDKLLKTRAGIPPTTLPEGTLNAPQKWNGPVPREAITEHTFGQVAPPISPNEGIPPGFDLNGGIRKTPFAGETELEPTRHPGPMDVPKDWLPSKREMGKPALGEKEIPPPRKPGPGPKEGTSERFPQGYNAEPEGKQAPGLQSKIPTGRGSMPKEEKAPGLNAQRREEEQLFGKLFGTELGEAENMRPDETQILPKRVTNEALKAPVRPQVRTPKFEGSTAPGVKEATPVKPPKIQPKIEATKPNATVDLLQALRDENTDLRKGMEGASEARRAEAQKRLDENMQFLQEHEQRKTRPAVVPGPNRLPFNIVTKKLMGQDVRWAQTHGLPDISIPNSMAEADIPKYVAEKQRLQAAGMAEIGAKHQPFVATQQPTGEVKTGAQLAAEKPAVPGYSGEAPNELVTNQPPSDILNRTRHIVIPGETAPAGEVPTAEDIKRANDATNMPDEELRILEKFRDPYAINEIRRRAKNKEFVKPKFPGKVI